ncbi:MAG: PPC domain-containing DNA-binding protein, partial [Candidatus Micrarchaeota archaeon]
VIRMERGEDVIGSLEKACEGHGVKGGLVFGIGALSRCTLYASASTEKLEPNAMELEEPLEIASAMGNITQKNGKPYIHLHCVLGRRDYSSVAGHLKQGIISLTGEFSIMCHDRIVKRERNDELQIELMKL